MNKETILDAIAPCSLCCYTCPAKKNGIIAESAKRLLNYHIGYYEFQCKTLPRKYKRYAKEEKKFIERLSKKTDPPCGGCRNGEHGKCCIKDCFVLECTLAHGVDFCGECSEFPCDKAANLFSGVVMADYLEGSKRIKEAGAEQYYREVTSRSHYQSFSDVKSK